MRTGMGYREIAFIAWHELTQMLRARETWLWAFLMPVLYMYVIGITAERVGRKPEGETLAMPAPPDAGFLGDRLERKLGAHYRIVRVRDQNMAGN